MFLCIICVHVNEYVCVRVRMCVCVCACVHVFLRPHARQTSRKTQSDLAVTYQPPFSFLRFFINFPYYLFRSASIGFLSYYCGTFGKFSHWHRRCHRFLVRASLFYSRLSFHEEFIPREIARSSVAGFIVSLPPRPSVRQ